MGGDQGVADIGARQEARERQALRQEGRHVLGRVNREIDPAVDQRLLDLLGEQAFAAEIGERPVAHEIARGADDHDLDRVVRDVVRGGERGLRGAGLPERKRAAARAEAEEGGCHFAGLSCGVERAEIIG